MTRINQSPSTRPLASQSRTAKPKQAEAAPAKSQGWAPKARTQSAPVPLRSGYLNPFQRTGEYHVMRDFGQSKASLPNEKLKAKFDEYKRDNFGNAPHVSELRMNGKTAYLFSARHGIGQPASVYIHSEAGRLIHSE